MSRLVQQGINNDIPYNTTIDNTFVLLGESDGVKEYKVYDSSKDAAQDYTLYKVNGVQLETKSYSSGE